MDAADLRRRYAAYEQRWAAQDWDGWIATLDPRYRFTVGAREIGGIAETLEWSRGVFAAMPDYRQEVLDVLVDGDRVVVEAVGEGTARGSAVRIPYVKVLRFGPAGLLDDRQYHDPSSLVAALAPR